MARSAVRPRAATIALPTTARPYLCLGCGRCDTQVRLALTQDGVQQGRTFLRRHAVCLAHF